MYLTDSQYVSLALEFRGETTIPFGDTSNFSKYLHRMHGILRDDTNISRRAYSITDEKKYLLFMIKHSS